MNQALAAFVHYYKTFDQHSLGDLDAIYADNIVFSDPVHVIRGRERLKTYFRSMCNNLTECRFEFIDEVVTDDAAFFKWEMYYRHPRIKCNAPLQMKGSTIVRFSDKIDSHEDFYDMGAMLYEHIPVIGNCINVIKAKIAKDSR